MKKEQIAVSPCCNPELDLDEVLAAYAELGFQHFEVFTSWVNSAFDYRGEPGYYLEKGRQFGMKFTSFHLPRIDADDLDSGIEEAIAAARFAEAIGVDTVLFKCQDRPTYLKATPLFLDELEGVQVTPVIQNHYGTALSRLEDVQEIYDGISDPRLKTLLEVGHFHSAGVTWDQAVSYLGNSIALVHVKDQIGRESVPYGHGEVDLAGLFRYMDSKMYSGQFVVEMEVKDKNMTLAYLAESLGFLNQFC